MPGLFSRDELQETAVRSPLDEAGRAVLGALRWSGGAALSLGALLLLSGLTSYATVITAAGMTMAVWVALAAVVGLMRGLSA